MLELAFIKQVGPRRPSIAPVDACMPAMLCVPVFVHDLIRFRRVPILHGVPTIECMRNVDRCGIGRAMQSIYGASRGSGPQYRHEEPHHVSEGTHTVGFAHSSHVIG